MLENQQIELLLKQNGFSGSPVITCIKQHNHLYKIVWDQEIAYLKIYTKDWYGEDVAGTGFCVDHEAAAWRRLSAAGLATPDILLADTTCHNALGRPYLLTRALAGQPFTRWAQTAVGENFNALTAEVGRYLRAMHKITFAYAGYITSSGPSAPPREDEYQHPIWTFQQFSRTARQRWGADRATVSSDVMDAVETFYERYQVALANAYAVPRFTHGDCHASQFFLQGRDDQWEVSGVVDLEVASAGDCGADFVQFCLEMAAQFPANSQWWQPLFAGYGGEPDFDLLKLRLFAADHASFSWLWPGSREAILRHILAASDWEMLFDLSALGMKSG